MKKLFFSAIFLVAVSSVSMGSTVAVESEIKEAKVVLLLRDDPCAGAYTNTYNANLAQYGHALANEMANAAWAACRKSKGLSFE